MNMYFVYILTNIAHSTLYIGFTNDLERRVREHKEKCVPGFTNKYNITKLIYFEEYDDPSEAYQRESRMKKWKRQWKINLINTFNPDWNDLSDGWYD